MKLLCYPKNAAEVIVHRSSPPYKEAYILASILNVATQPYKFSITNLEDKRAIAVKGAVDVL